jgi:type II secretory pathway pseudopilin PulG
VTVSIIALLLTAAAAGIARARRTGRDAQRVRDVFAIATAVDQSATTNRGSYPYNATSKTTGSFCASGLGTATSNPNNLNFGGFVARTIPMDPSPETPAGICANYRNGYTFHNRYGGANLAKPGAGAQNYEYVIEVGLETERPSDEQSLVLGADSSSAVRTQFLVTGKACSPDTGAGTCSIP